MDMEWKIDLRSHMICIRNLHLFIYHGFTQNILISKFIAMLMWHISSKTKYKYHSFQQLYVLIVLIDNMSLLLYCILLDFIPVVCNIHYAGRI